MTGRRGPRVGPSRIDSLHLAEQSVPGLERGGAAPDWTHRWAAGVASAPPRQKGAFARGGAPGVAPARGADRRPVQIGAAPRAGIPESGRSAERSWPSLDGLLPLPSLRRRVRPSTSPDVPRGPGSVRSIGECAKSSRGFSNRGSPPFGDRPLGVAARANAGFSRALLPKPPWRCAIGRGWAAPTQATPPRGGSPPGCLGAGRLGDRIRPSSLPACTGPPGAQRQPARSAGRRRRYAWAPRDLGAPFPPPQPRRDYPFCNRFGAVRDQPRRT